MLPLSQLQYCLTKFYFTNIRTVHYTFCFPVTTTLTGYSQSHMLKMQLYRCHLLDFKTWQLAEVTPELACNTVHIVTTQNWILVTTGYHLFCGRAITFHAQEDRVPPNSNVSYQSPGDKGLCSNIVKPLVAQTRRATCPLTRRKDRHRLSRLHRWRWHRRNRRLSTAQRAFWKQAKWDHRETITASGKTWVLICKRCKVSINMHGTVACMTITVDKSLNSGNLDEKIIFHTHCSQSSFAKIWCFRMKTKWFYTAALYSLLRCVCVFAKKHLKYYCKYRVLLEFEHLWILKMHENNKH